MVTASRYFINYVERPPQLIASHLGGDISEILFQLPANDSMWHGPFESRFGSHLVLITSQEPARSPSFQEVRERVQTDAQAARAREQTEAAIQNIMDQYDVVVSPELTNSQQTVE